MRQALGILALGIFVCVGWLLLHWSPPAPKEVNQPPSLPPATNIGITAPTPTAPPLAISSNALVRPDSIDEDHWNRLMLVRQLALEQNQPVEFYARVLDQNEQPVEEARLTLKLTRTDEKMFETTNFFHKNMGDEVLTIPLELISDVNGWVQVTGTNGYFLSIWGLNKEGYLSSYPDGNFGGVHYEPQGRRNTSGGDILLTNALNPNVGYTFRLEKQ